MNRYKITSGEDQNKTISRSKFLHFLKSEGESFKTKDFAKYLPPLFK